MTAMDIEHEDYRVRYDEANAIVTCQGSLRLHDDEYKSIRELLVTAADAKPESLTLDVRELRFLNSSGIHSLLKFVLQVRKHNVSKVLVQGSARFPWQAKSLKNLQRVLPGLQMEIA